METEPSPSLPKITAASPTLWLASASPRRRQLLEQLGLAPEVWVSAVTEERARGESPRDYTLRLSAAKGRAARTALGTRPASWIVAADTVVVLGEEVLEKPVDAADAVAMLGRLSGREHAVVTGFWIGDSRGQVERSTAVVSRVRFRPMSAGEIAGYVATGEPMDKAGAYGIQGIGGAFVTSVEGSYFNIVGLPIAELVEALLDVGALERFPLVVEPQP